MADDDVIFIKQVEKVTEKPFTTYVIDDEGIQILNTGIRKARVKYVPRREDIVPMGNCMLLNAVKEEPTGESISEISDHNNNEDIIENIFERLARPCQIKCVDVIKEKSKHVQTLRRVKDREKDVVRKKSRHRFEDFLDETNSKRKKTKKKSRQYYSGDKNLSDFVVSDNEPIFYDKWKDKKVNVNERDGRVGNGEGTQYEKKKLKKLRDNSDMDYSDSDSERESSISYNKKKKSKGDQNSENNLSDFVVSDSEPIQYEKKNKKKHPDLKDLSDFIVSDDQYESERRKKHRKSSDEKDTNNIETKNRSKKREQTREVKSTDYNYNGSMKKQRKNSGVLSDFVVSDTEPLRYDNDKKRVSKKSPIVNNTSTSITNTKPKLGPFDYIRQGQLKVKKLQQRTKKNNSKEMLREARRKQKCSDNDIFEICIYGHSR